MKITTILFLLIISISLSSAQLEIININEQSGNLINLDSAIDTIKNFLGLSDTPSSYSGQAGQCVVVNPGENALTFGNCSNSTSGGGSADFTNVAYLNNTQTFTANQTINASLFISGNKSNLDFTNSGGDIWLTETPSFIPEYESNNIIWTNESKTQNGRLKFEDDVSLGYLLRLGSRGDVIIHGIGSATPNLFIDSGSLDLDSDEGNIQFGAGGLGNQPDFKIKYDSTNGYFIFRGLSSLSGAFSKAFKFNDNNQQIDFLVDTNTVENAFIVNGTSEEVVLNVPLVSNNDCGIPNSVSVFERTSPSSNQGMASGNGDVLRGDPQACSGIVTAIAGSCENCASGTKEIAMELRINGVSQTCDVPQLTTAQDVDSTTCNVAFAKHDVVGCYTKTETGAVTGIRCSIYMRYD